VTRNCHLLVQQTHALGALGCAAILAGALVALVQVVRTRTMNSISQIIWALIILGAPAVGAIAWFAIGNRTVSDRWHLRLPLWTSPLLDRKR